MIRKINISFKLFSILVKMTCKRKQNLTSIQINPFYLGHIYFLIFIMEFFKSSSISHV